jgi:hypothetical protein
VRALRQLAELVQKIVRRAVEGDLDEVFVLYLGGSKEIQTEDRGQGSGIVVPDHVVADEEAPEEPVQVAHPGSHLQSIRAMIRLPYQTSLTLMFRSWR